MDCGRSGRADEALLHRRAHRGDAGALRTPRRHAAAIRAVGASAIFAPIVTPPNSSPRAASAGTSSSSSRAPSRPTGLTLFTLRMGDWRELEARGGRLYAEKAIMSEDGQRAPHHYHVVKTEDIVNRGGARFVVELFKVDRSGRPVEGALPRAEGRDRARSRRPAIRCGSSRARA